MIPERIYALVPVNIVKYKIELGDSYRISPDGQTAIVCIKKDTAKHRLRLLGVSLDEKILSVEEARAIVNEWDNPPSLLSRIASKIVGVIT